MEGSTDDDVKKDHVDPMKILVIAEGKIKEGRKKLHLEEVKVFEPEVTEPDRLQIIFYTFNDGHIEVYEDALEMLFDERIADTIPQYIVLVKGEMTRPLSMAGNQLIRLELSDGSEYGESLDEQIVQVLATGTTANVKSVFEREVQPFPEHQFLFLKMEPNEQTPQAEEMATESEPWVSTSVRRSATSSGSRQLPHGKDDASSKVALKTILTEFKPNAEKNPLRWANGVDGESKVMAHPDKVNKRKPKEDKSKASKLLADGAVGASGVSPQKPTPRKKSEKAKRPKSTSASPKTAPREDTSSTRFSPRLKTIDENLSHAMKAKKIALQTFRNLDVQGNEDTK